MTTCSIDSCGKPVAARSWCKAHWTRWRRNGDPCGGRRTPGDLSALLQSLLKMETDECITWPSNNLNRYGYAVIKWEGKQQRVNRVVCGIMRGSPTNSKMHAAHSCGNRACVNHRHLRWATPTENQADRLLHGTDGRGEKNVTSKVSEQDARAIRHAWKARESNQAEIGKRFGITQSAVSSIVTGKNWGWLDDNPN